jgi:hypothetical protein
MSDKPHGHGKPGDDSPLNLLWVSMTGASTDHATDAPGVNEKSQAVGHEPDEFGVKGIIAVPAAVVIALVITYLVVTGIFAIWKTPQYNAAAQNQRPANERFGKISSTDPHAVDGRPNSAVPQPRLEGIRQIEDKRSGESQSDPPYLRSFPDKEDGNNSPQIYPQFLRAENYVDPTTGKKALLEGEWISKEKGTATIPIEDAFKLLTTTKKPAAAKAPTAPVLGTQGQAKLSTGGRGGPSEPKVAPKVEHDHKH